MTEKFNGEFEKTGNKEVTKEDDDLVKSAMKKMVEEDTEM